MVLYLCVLIVFLLHSKSQPWQQTPLPNWFCHSQLRRVGSIGSPGSQCTVQWAGRGALLPNVPFHGMAWWALPSRTCGPPFLPPHHSCGVGCDRNLGSGTFGGADFSGCDGFYDARHPCPTPLLRMSRHCPPQQLLPLLWCSSRTSRQVRPCAAASASLPCRCPRDTQLKKWGLL
jgi:hypothetical protein